MAGQLLGDRLRQPLGRGTHRLARCGARRRGIDLDPVEQQRRGQGIERPRERERRGQAQTMRREQPIGPEERIRLDPVNRAGRSAAADRVDQYRDVRTGQVAWRDGTFGKVNMLRAGEKVILLDEGGNVARVTLTPEGMNVRWNVQLLQEVAWTSPILVGTRLYMRDRQKIIALELS